MNVAPINSLSSPTFTSKSKIAFGKSSDVNSATFDTSQAERVSHAKFDPVKQVLIIHSTIKNAFDSDSWYTIKEDGSGQYNTCWHPKIVQYEEGTLKDVYEQARLVYEENNAAIPDEFAKILVENIKNRHY